jgi:hypothetical protein
LLDHICIFQSQGKHKTWDCDQLQGFANVVFKMTKRPIKRKGPKNRRAIFPKHIRRSDMSMEVLTPMSLGGSRNSQPGRSWWSHPPPPDYLKWFEVSITFDRSDHPNFVPKPGWHPLIVSPIVKDVKLNHVLINGRGSLNILFLKTFDQMGLSRTMHHPS